METITILKNQVLIMQILIYVHELNDEMGKHLREQIMFTEGIIRSMS